MRLNRAPALLMHQDANVPRIAMNPGFGSLSTFNKSIRKLTGMARSNFRKGLASAKQARAWHGSSPSGSISFPAGNPHLGAGQAGFPCYNPRAFKGRPRRFP
ncbi:helix-turn-helix domain-containing protein [Mesorhizobium sp. B2-4-17]|uniref:helix-turn-helix domain-containing protein n=2 Tax=unclassified Mesorhizobium TaxID=325217 RepID=UPI0032B1FF6B